MKKTKFLPAILMFLLILSGCSDNSSKETTFVYAMGLDKSRTGVTLCVLAGNGSGSESAESSGKDDENNEEKDGGAEKNKNIFMLFYGGKNVGEVFGKFFEENKSVYTASIKEYAVSEELGDEGMFDFKVYLTDSPRLPAKRKTSAVSSAAEYISEKAAEFAENR